MTDMTIKQFCYKHGACKAGKAWALDNCSDMQQVWETIKPAWLIWIATRKVVLTDKELRLFAVHCARSVERLLTDQRSRSAIDVAERYAHGTATDEELAAAYTADAYSAAAACAAAAACDAAYTAAAYTSAYSADAYKSQAAYLRKNCKPNFEVQK